MMTRILALAIRFHADLNLFLGQNSHMLYLTFFCFELSLHNASYLLFYLGGIAFSDLDRDVSRVRVLAFVSGLLRNSR